MPSLVLEGGTLRPIFSAGVMDAMLEENVMFPYCIGVSAGACEAASYLSRQFKRNLVILQKYRNDARYLGPSNILRCKSIFGLDFVFGEIPNKLLPFDNEVFLQYPGRFLIGVTNADTGEIEYLDGMKNDEKWSAFRATCAIPVYFPAIQVNGQAYYDGGLTDPIPIRKAIADGNEKHLIILTQPKGFVKKLGKQNKWAARLLRHRHPNVTEAILRRHVLYNETIKLCQQLEAEGKAVILQPEAPLDSFEKRVPVLEATWKQGYDLGKAHMEQIKALFD